MIDKIQTICKEILITNLLFAFKFNVVMASFIRIYQANLEGQSQADCCVDHVPVGCDEFIYN